MIKRIAVNQPYLFPYLGFYQMVTLSDIFIFFDDVNFIKEGYIHRNSILYQNKAYRFTVPVLCKSSNKKINDLFFSSDTKNILKTIETAYRNSPRFQDVFPLVEHVVTQPDRNVARLAATSVQTVFDYLGIPKEFCFSSEIDYDRQASAEGKILSICTQQNATHYINAIGGQELYNKKHFEEKNIILEFIQKNPVTYPQGQSLFIDSLSIIDVLMWNKKEAVINLLKQYELKEPTK